MKEERDYIQDITAIRTMMERSSKFLSLSGWAGIMAGVYALSAAYIAYKVFGFNPTGVFYDTVQTGSPFPGLLNVILLSFITLILALGTAVFLSHRKANKKGEKAWNPTAKRLLIHMSVPLVVGGSLILILISNGMVGLMAPFTLIFYGLALYNASKFTYEEVKTLGFIEIALGLIGAYFVEYGLLIWAFGFGVVHIVYGIYMHYRFER